jgi:hypothetical protein
MNVVCLLTRRSFGARQSSSVQTYIFRAFLVKRASAVGAKSTPPPDCSEMAVQSTDAETILGRDPV